MSLFDDWSKEDLAWKCRELTRKIEELTDENSKKSVEINSLKFRIETELDPRIEAERRSYDRFVTDARNGGCV